ncbi:hypothetical protein RDI58_017795 [Solanum bulbocastanum]|uniref:Shikimate dehydrogenase substrate binding N-terminal domain-containing protein n=1 Tax=Solanum bulbocastanum TaxID=147425 RepID=A0AAN8TA54_SOLBU
MYLLVDDIANFFWNYSSFDFAGFSCTIPHKEAALYCCTEIDPTTKAIGAINCIMNRPDGKLSGCNTYYIGAIFAIEEGLQGSQPSISGSPLAGKLFVVVGASGARKAIAYGAKEKGARVLLVANHTMDITRTMIVEHSLPHKF